MRITWDDSLKKRWNWDIPGYPWDQRRGIPTYPDLSLHIPSYTKVGYPGISHYKNLILAYPKTSFLSRLIPGYPGIGHMSGYPGITLYKSGYGRVSLFQRLFSIILVHIQYSPERVLIWVKYRVWGFIWNLGIHDFRYEFMIFFKYMNSYMNS